MRAGAAGLYCVMAAVELLIGQERWLHRGDFVASFIELVPAAGEGETMAFVDWRRATARLKRGQLVCSSGEGQLLQLCASLAEGVPIDLGNALTSVDTSTVVLVAEAVLRAGGCADPAPWGHDGGAR
ncbi:hypothetical protein [Streptomyces sp. NPDC001978]|uniref:hypothetical protein n=1 Tax=Streptomyces sp. NPDC001978 TaxID=3364627 RepID=UPI003693F174